MAFQPRSKLVVHPLTPSRWRDFETLFGSNGACDGCWCMWPRLGAGYARTKGAKNKRSMKALVDAGIRTGILGYVDGQPVTWLALGPREEYAPLSRSRVMKPLDDRPAWVVMCFFTAKEHRGKGLATPMLNAAAKFAKQHGATLLEGFPNEVDKQQAPVFVWQGVASSFERAGFTEVARRSKRRPYMRRELGNSI